MNALEFATKAHKNQFRWDDTTPYIEHPKAVVKLLESWKIKNEEILNAGYLHDVLEDTDVTKAEIRHVFGIIVANLVSELTRGKHEDYFEHCKKMTKHASLIKVADILCNLTDTDGKKSPKFVQKRLTALSILQEHRYLTVLNSVSKN